MYFKTDNSFYHRDVIKIHCGSIPRGWEVHRCDCNSNNNDIDNLLPCPKHLHIFFHKLKLTKKNMALSVINSVEYQSIVNSFTHERLVRHILKLSENEKTS